MRRIFILKQGHLFLAPTSFSKLQNNLCMHKILVALTAIIILAGACTKLDVPVESQYIETNFPKTQADFVSLIGPIYTQLATRYAIEYFRMQELTTDELILPG